MGALDLPEIQLKLLQRLSQLIMLNAQQQRALCGVTESRFLSKGEVLLEKGEVANYIHFVADGILRLFCDRQGRAVTRWFCFEGQFGSAYFSFVYRQPSEDTMVAVTNTQILSISRNNLQALCEQDAVWVDLNRRLLEYHYTTLLDRILSFQTQSAKERYLSLLAEYPSIETQVPLGDLASYLGMSQETLSRLRTKRKKQ